MTHPDWLVGVLSVVFVVTGLHSLVRWGALCAGREVRHGDATTELGHLLMSGAMLAMVWGWTHAGAELAQIVCFTVLFVVFGARLVAGRVGASAHARRSSSYHLLAMGAMVWMLAQAPLAAGLAGLAAGGAPSVSGHGVHLAASPAPSSPGPTPAPIPPSPIPPAPPWAETISTLLLALLLVCAVCWAARLVRQGGRVHAACHCAGSLGMAAMVLAMV